MSKKPSKPANNNASSTRPAQRPQAPKPKREKPPRTPGHTFSKPESKPLKYVVLKRIPQDEGDTITDRYPPEGSRMTVQPYGTKLWSIYETGRTIMLDRVRELVENGFLREVND